MAFSFDGWTFSIDGPDDDQSVTGIVKESGAYEDWIWRNVVGLLASDDICIDVGANIGVTTLILSSRVVKGHIYAIEPNPLLAGFLQMNLLKNVVGNATVHRIGFGSACGVASLSVHDKDGGYDYGGGQIVDENIVIPGTSHTRIRVVDMDGWVENMRIARIDFIKIDVEGFELEVVRGGVKTIARFRPRVVIEYFPEKLRRISRNADHGLVVLLLRTFPFVYRIDRFTMTLMRVRSYAQLRAQMMTGHGVEDLLCDWRSIPRGLESQYAEFSSYEASHVQLYGSTLHIDFLSHFNDGWICGRQCAAIVTNSGSDPIAMELNVWEASCENSLNLYIENEFTELLLARGGVGYRFEVACNPGCTVIYCEVAHCVSAASYFNNEDPRNISARVGLSILRDRHDSQERPAVW